MFELAIERDGKTAMRRLIGDTPLTIGRSPDNCLAFSDPEISRHHCRIEMKGQSLSVTDLSKNGTFINGELKRECALASGDVLRVGPWTLVVGQPVESACANTVAAAHQPTSVIKYDEKKRNLTSESIMISAGSPGTSPVKKKISAAEITIGHSTVCDVSVADTFVSRRHCKILNQDGVLKLIDLASTNGTYINDVRVDQTVIPSAGEFRIGRTKISYKIVKKTERLPRSKRERFGPLIGPSRPMREIYALMERAGPTDANICITGESGTGKELVARELHNLSGRRNGPFVAINCGAVPESIIEGQLFGHERGAFTGAVERAAGLFEQAKDGTIFLDEIGEMPLNLQTRLLRVLETKAVRRVGGQEEIPVNARVISATNRNLKMLVADGRFRADLFHRLFVVPISIPPLAERPDDVRSLARHFAGGILKDGAPCELSDSAMQALLKHRWPGNVRELKNTIERTIVISGKRQIDARDLKIEIMPDRMDGGKNLKDKERDLLASALCECENNLSKVAKKLGIARTTVQSKIKRYAISIPRKISKGG